MSTFSTLVLGLFEPMRTAQVTAGFCWLDRLTRSVGFIGQQTCNPSSNREAGKPRAKVERCLVGIFCWGCSCWPCIYLAGLGCGICDHGYNKGLSAVARPAGSLTPREAKYHVALRADATSSWLSVRKGVGYVVGTRPGQLISPLQPGTGQDDVSSPHRNNANGASRY